MVKVRATLIREFVSQPMSSRMQRSCDLLFNCSLVQLYSVRTWVKPVEAVMTMSLVCCREEEQLTSQKMDNDFVRIDSLQTHLDPGWAQNCS